MFDKLIFDNLDQLTDKVNDISVNLLYLVPIFSFVSLKNYTN
jgi:hypothetical protein